MTAPDKRDPSEYTDGLPPDWEEHLNGDPDGLGPIRGIVSIVKILVALAGGGFALYHAIQNGLPWLLVQDMAAVAAIGAACVSVSCFVFAWFQWRAVGDRRWVFGGIVFGVTALKAWTMVGAV